MGESKNEKSKISPHLRIKFVRVQISIVRHIDETSQQSHVTYICMGSTKEIYV